MPADYYGLPLLKAPVWTWEVPAYFFAGGTAHLAYYDTDRENLWYAAQVVESLRANEPHHYTALAHRTKLDPAEVSPQELGGYMTGAGAPSAHGLGGLG